MRTSANLGLFMRRREFIAVLGGAVAWPAIAAQVQQGGRMRRIGVLMGFDEDDPEGKARISAFTQALGDLGWTDGRNVRMDLRRYRNDITRARTLAQEPRAEGYGARLSHTESLCN